MDDNFVGLYWTVHDPASTMPRNEGQELGMVNSVPISGLSGLVQMPEATAKRQIYSKEQWLALKSVIQRLYIDEGQTFLEVADYLDRNHGFRPTRKQFLTRVKEWGFEKNVKRDERRAILESLGDGWKEGEFQAAKLRGRRLDKAKIERWRKREGMVSDGAQTELGETLSSGYDEAPLPVGGRETMDHALNLNNETDSVSGQMELNYDDVAEEIPRDGFQQTSIAMNQPQLFNPWSVVDIVGSPRLTGLIGALTLEACGDITDLDLSASYREEADGDCDLVDADEACSDVISKQTHTSQTSVKAHQPSLSSNIAALSNRLAKECQRWMPGPLDELCVFPKTGYRRRLLGHPKTDHLASEESVKMNELDCKRKLKTLDKLDRPGLIDLVERIRSVAHRHSELDHDRIAEIWWRRVVTCSLKIEGYHPSKLLFACLQVVRSIHGQGRILEAKNLHRGLHEKIMSLVGPEHELGIISADILAYSFSGSEDSMSEASIRRQLLQICLLRFGPRDTLSLEMLLGLGWALNNCYQYEEAETLLNILIGLDCEMPRHADNSATWAQVALLSRATLAWSLNEQQKYDESAQVLESSQKQFRTLLEIESYCCWEYYDEKVDLLISTGRLLECEQLLRPILRQIDKTGIWAAAFMQNFAYILIETSRGVEATSWLERIFWEGIEKEGIECWRSSKHCKQLGFCYAYQGRYDDAILHFSKTIEILALGPVDDPEFRAEFVENIHEWICKVEEMRHEAEAEASATFTILEERDENFVDFPLETELAVWNAEDPSM